MNQWTKSIMSESDLQGPNELVHSGGKGPLHFLHHLYSLLLDLPPQIIILDQIAQHPSYLIFVHIQIPLRPLESWPYHQPH